MSEPTPPYVTGATAEARPGFDGDLSPIRRAHPTPYYAQLAEILRDGIDRGLWRPGELIPSEADLGSFFGISRTVVRQALNELVADGLVYKEKGRGTFVSTPKVADLVIHEIRGFADELRGRGHDVQTEVLRAQAQPMPAPVAAHLGLDADAWGVHLTRLRRVDGDPIVRVDTYLPHARFASLLDTDLADVSLYDALERDFGVHPAGGWRRIETAVAGSELADDLDVARGAPILVLTAVSEDGSGVPFEYFRAAYRGDRTSFEIRVTDPRA